MPADLPSPDPFATKQAAMRQERVVIVQPDHIRRYEGGEIMPGVPPLLVMVTKRLGKLCQ